ncbi:UDP-N-acetylmuramoyl-tripeptide--D-alanyl-D-alanine ligase [soil metagenome]
MSFDGEAVAAWTGAEPLSRGAAGSPSRAVVDSSDAGPGDLFFGLPGSKVDGGQFALDAVRARAWGVVAGPQWAREIVEMRDRGAHDFDAWVFAAPDPLLALQELARHRRRDLACPVIGITGSTGKTTVKDICASLLPVAHVHASPENYNTEIGLPLSVLGAPEGTAALVLEMGMRGRGQIAELAAIAEPDVGVITNVGPVHVELLGSIEAVAETKAELVGGLREGGSAVVPAVAGELEPFLGAAPGLIRFGDGGDVYARESEPIDGGGMRALVVTPAGEQEFSFPFAEAHNLANALAAIAAGVALGMPLGGMADRAPGIVFSALRGELVPLRRDSILINDSYNANPVSMRAALDHLATLPTAGRRIAVLGDMRELGADSPRHHREIGAHAREIGVELLIGVGELAPDYGPDEHVADAAAAAEALDVALGEGDVVLVKGSRAVGLEAVAERLGVG